MPASELSRRSLLVIGGSGTVLTLAACAATTTGPASPKTDAQSGAPSAPQEVAKLSEIPVGGAISATLSGAGILLSQPQAGTVLAFSSVCPHQGCAVAPAGAELECPCHQSRFDLATGDVLDGPAQRPLDALTVTVDGDTVLVG